jgi:hypothetical protein
MAFDWKGGGKQQKTSWISLWPGQDFTMHLLNTSLKLYFYTNLFPWVKEIRLKYRWIM